MNRRNPRLAWWSVLGVLGMSACLLACSTATMAQHDAEAKSAISGGSGAADAGIHADVPANIYPKALRPGDTIMFIAPAGQLNEKRVALAVKRLRGMGFKVIVPKDLFRKYGFLAGDDATRAAELMRGFTDPEVDAVFPGTGGYGATRILELLDYDAIAKNPKVFIGFSDITALHTAIHQRTGLVTFHTPSPQWGLGSEEGMDPLAERFFWRAILAKAYEEDTDGPGWVYDFTDFKDAPTLETVAPGVARGRLIGGNLSLVSAMIGTPFEVQTDGAVLFLEDVREAPYRVDRMLRQLKSAGKLDGLAGVILGQFTRVDPEDEEDWSIHDVIEDYFKDAPYPVVMNFPVGHVRKNTSLPVGAMVEVDADQRIIRVLEDPARP